MTERNRVLFYKFVPIGLVLVDLFMLFKCAFFELSEKLISYFQIGGKVIGFLENFISGSLSETLSSMSQGSITLLEFQKIYKALGDYAYIEEDGEYISLIVQTFYWCIVLFVIAAVIEMILHMVNSKIQGIWCVMNVILTIYVLSFWAYTIDIFKEDFGISSVRFTPWAICVLIIPFIETIIWHKYISISKKIKTENPETETNQKSVKIHLHVDVNERKKYFTKHKTIVLLLGIFIALNLMIFVLGYIEVVSFLITLLDAFFAGLMVLYACHYEWKMLEIYAVAVFFGEFLSNFYNLRYFNALYTMALLGSGIILAAAMYMMMKLDMGKHRLLIMSGVVILLKTIIIPLCGSSMYLSSAYYTLVDIVLRSRSTYIQLIVILCPVILYLVKPEYIYIFNNLSLITEKGTLGKDGKESDTMSNTEKTGEDIKKSVEIKKIDVLLKEIKNNNEKIYTALGEKVYELQDTEDGIYGELIRRVNDLKAENIRINKKINYLNGIVVCPQCEFTNKAGQNFCIRCGFNLTEENEETNGNC